MCGTTRLLVLIALNAGPFGVAAQEPPPAPEAILDVTLRGLGTLDPNQQHEWSGTSLPSGVRYGGVPDKKIRVTLVGFDPPTSAWGDLFKFEMRIENVGKIPVEIPWSSEPALVDAERQGAPDLAGALVQLTVGAGDGTGDLVPVSVQALAGSRRDPDRLHVLLPGERALLRMFGRWETNFSGRALPPDGMVRVQATLDLPDEGLITPSANSLATTLTRVR